MDQSIFVVLGKLLAVLGLVAANGFFVTAEFSLVGVRRSRIDELVAQGHGRARMLRRAIDDLNDHLAATQLGVTVSSLGLGWIGEPALAQLIEPGLGLLGPWASVGAHAIATAVAFLIITVFHIVLGERVPKSVALQQPEGTRSASSAHRPSFRQFWGCRLKSSARRTARIATCHPHADELMCRNDRTACSQRLDGMGIAPVAAGLAR